MSCHTTGWRCASSGAQRATSLPEATTTLRAKNQAALKEILEREFAKHGAEELIARFRAAGVPCAPINTYSKALADPQVAHMQWIREIALPGGGKARTFASPLRFSGKGLPIRRDPPALDEHNDEVFGSSRAAAE